MGIACFAIWNSKDSLHKKCALHLYAIQLGLNAFWTPIFFGAHNLWLALLIIILLWLFILFTIITFHRIKPWTAYILIPYLAWVSFASILNFAFAWLN
jgi:tryptophan-rich sensory protein